MEYGCIAEKLGHSFSAEIHKRLFDYKYELKEVKKEDLHEFMTARDFKAVNVTIPYKTDVIPYLDFLSDTAKEIGAVNTVVNRGGKLYGYNTDLGGLISLIKFNGIDIKNKKVLILGSGGTSKTAYVAAKKLCCSQVVPVSRNKKDGFVTYEEAVKEHSDAQIIINTTPCGMYPNIYESAIDISPFKELEGVVDAVYNPLRSKLVCDAGARNVKAVGGLYMLVAQAALAAEKFINESVSEKRITEIYFDILQNKQNVVLIGMPASGKTTVGKLLAQKLKKEFIDTDLLITEVYGKTPSEIITEKGEKIFRDIEEETVASVAIKQNVIIATGGGTILRKKNVELLRENGRIYFIDRPVDKLEITSDRPLSLDREALQRRYEERYEIYLSSCDVKITDPETAQEAEKLIEEDFYNENTCN